MAPLLVLAACHDADTSPFPLPWDASTGLFSRTGALTVAYSASGTGDSCISRLTYATDGGPITVEYPSLPFAVNVELTTARALNSASGTPRDGRITVGYVLSDQTGPVENAQASCP